MVIIKYLFSKILTKKLEIDSNLQSKLKNLDTAMDNLNASIEKAEKDGIVLPDELKKYLGRK